MMKDWTDIIGEELENIEEPLPADDWSALQQKYAASRRRKRAGLFAWTGGITSVAAAVALVLLLVRPDAVPSDDDLVADELPPVEEVLPADTVSVDAPSESPETVTPGKTRRMSPSVNLRKPSDDVLIAQDKTDVKDEVSAEEDVFDVVKDTVKVTERLLADADNANDKKDVREDDQPDCQGSEDFPDEEPRRRRRPIAIGISGSASDSPIMTLKTDLAPEPPMDMSPPFLDDGLSNDSLRVETPQQAMGMMRAKSGYSDSYRHEIPVSIGISARFFVTDRLSINTGLNYTRYKSLRTRIFDADHDQQKDWQYVHYLGVPVRLDLMAVNRKHFNLYFGAGLQMDKCVHAAVGEERLSEKQILFGLNGAMGLQVNIVPMVGLYFEPEVSYALNGGSIETFRSDEPFVITVRAGLRFNF